jgi:peptidoglycan/xylan/chitin deacetylase (PgdA/CDA1 family)
MHSARRTPIRRAISRPRAARVSALVTLPPVLCYHKVERRHELGVTRISPRRFARHIERLAAAGWKSIGLSEVIACAIGDRVAAPNELAITFDDGYRGLRDYAFPVLEAVGFGATCFVITDYAGRLNRWDVAYGGRRFAHLAWRDMRAWQGRGIEFASHTATHPRLTRLSESAVSEELQRSRRAIAEALDVETPAVSYPFGAGREREERLAREAGYGAGFGIARGWSGSVMSIARVPVYVWAPMMPVVGVLRDAERLAGAIANRCAIGTTLLRPSSVEVRSAPASILAHD